MSAGGTPSVGAFDKVNGFTMAPGISHAVSAVSCRKAKNPMRRIWFFALLCLAMAAPSNIGAYALQGPHVLDLMVQRLSGLRTLQIVQETTLEGGLEVENPLVSKERLSYSFPDSFRSESRTRNSHRIHVAAGRETVTIVEGQILSLKNPYDRYKDLLLHRTRALIHKKLLAHGVDVEKTSLGRFGERTVYVLGADYPDESVSQIMVDKESLLPLRWLNILSDNPEERLEFVYSDWQKTGEAWYPMQIEIYHNRDRVRQIKVTGVEINPTLSPETFSIAHLKRIYPPAESVGPTRPPSSTSEDEVDRTIKEFQKKFSTE